MSYGIIKLDVERIIESTRETGDLPRVASDVERELGERTLRLAETEEKGSGQKGSLEQAISHFRISFERFPTIEVAHLLGCTYKLLGDVKKAHGMPGYEEDYARSDYYQIKANEISAQRRGPERSYPR